MKDAIFLTRRPDDARVNPPLFVRGAAHAGRRRRGKIELAVSRGIREIGDLPRGLGGLAESALMLARLLDESDETDPDKRLTGAAQAARELRSTLTELARGVDRDDSPADAISAFVAGLADPLSAQVEYR